MHQACSFYGEWYPAFIQPLNGKCSPLAAALGRRADETLGKAAGSLGGAGDVGGVGDVGDAGDGFPASMFDERGTADYYRKAFGFL